MLPEQTLKRSISLPLLTLYGLGTTISAGIFVLILFQIEGLAGVTSIVSLTIFAVVNLTLLRLKWTRPAARDQKFSVPGRVPFLGLLASLALVVFDIWRRLS